MTPQAALQRVIEHREIFHDEMLSLMRQIMGGEVSPVMIAAIITGLRVKKETIGEIAAAASVMRELSTPGARCPTTTISSTSSAPAAMRRTPSISPPPPAFVAAAAGAQGGQARRPQRVVQFRQRRRAGSAGRQHHAVARAGRRLYRGNRHRLHVRAQSPQRHEARGAGAPRNGRAHPVQHPRSADQPGQCAATR